MTPNVSIRQPRRNVTDPVIMGFVAEVLPWFARNARDLPWRRTRDPYAIWVSEVMLQQTQVKTVIPYWERWIKELPSIDSLARCRTDRVLKLWEGLGYYHRARNLQNAAQLIMREHEGQFPKEFNAVLRLPGIGRYTAGAICSIAFDAPTPILDGNAIRVLTRFFGVRGDPGRGETNRQLWTLAQGLVKQAQGHPGERNCSAFNQALMELGATVCTATNPACDPCPVRAACSARKTGRVGALPELPARMKSQRRRFVALVFEKSGKFFLRQRPGGVVNAGLWEFPNEELASRDRPAKVARHIAGADVRPLCTIRHTITRYRMTLEVFWLATPDPNLGRTGRWFSARQAAGLAYPSAHRQVLEHALQQLTRSTRAGGPAQAARAGNSPHDRRLRSCADRC